VPAEITDRGVPEVKLAQKGQIMLFALVKKTAVGILHNKTAGMLFMVGVSASGFTTNSATAASYFVDNSMAGASDSNKGTSPAAPWASLKAVMSKTFMPGDTISLKAGTSYSGGLQLTVKGTAAAPITINAYGVGPKPVIKGNPTYGSYFDAIELDNSEYVVVDGVSLTSSSQAGVNLYHTNNSVVRNSEMFGVGIGVNVLGQKNLVTGNSFHDLKMVVNNGTAGNYGAVGVVVGGPSNEISFNTCLRCIASDNFFGVNGKLIELFGPVDGAYIHHNYAQDSGNFLEAGVGTARNVRIVYNLSYNNNGGFLCVHYKGDFAYTGPTSFLVANNTAVQSLPISNPANALNYIDTPPSSSSIQLINNIMAIDKMAAFYSYDVPRQNNVYYMKQSSSHILSNWSNLLGSGEIIANPKFISEAFPDFRLSATSPARSRALTSSAVGNVDFAQTTLPASGRDAGAFQYQP
jgi:hypothetical protein